MRKSNHALAKGMLDHVFYRREALHHKSMASVAEGCIVSETSRQKLLAVSKAQGVASLGLVDGKSSANLLWASFRFKQKTS